MCIVEAMNETPYFMYGLLGPCMMFCMCSRHLMQWTVVHSVFVNYIVFCKH